MGAKFVDSTHYLSARLVFLVFCFNISIVITALEWANYNTKTSLD